LGYNPKEPLMKILFAIGIAVSALLLTSCSNPDTSGGVAVTMSRDNASEFPDGSCEGPGKFTDGLNTGCGWIYPNKWIKGYYIQPDANLHGADLYGANLTGANLSGADLSGANLYDADLRYAFLTGANLSGVYLRYADLSGAYLRYADLSGTDLYGVDLRYAFLTGANLSGVYLRYADLSGAYLTLADLTLADLMGAKADSSTTCPNGKPWGIGGSGNCPF
jgi:hypothetical protein